MLSATGHPRIAADPASLAIDRTRRRVRLSPTDPRFVQNPYPAYAAIRAACPMFFWDDYGFWCLADHAAVSALFRDRRFGRDVSHVASRDALGWPEIPDHLKPFYAFEERSMLEREPPAHTRLRTLVNRAFVSRTVARLKPRIAELAHALIDRFPSAGTVDLISAFAEPIPVTVIAEMLGVPAAMAPQLLAWSHSMVAMYQTGRTREVEDAAVDATRAFSEFMRGLVADRRVRPGDDILSLLAAEADGERLTEDELITNAILLLNAGHEATVHAIGNGVATLLGAGLGPELFANAAATASAVEELLRFDPPLHMFTRYALEPVEIDGIRFQVGDKVGLLIGAANRDPAIFPEPDRFDPARGSTNHVAFGGGIHFCVGAPLARLELQTALPILFDRLPNLTLNSEPAYADRYHFHGLKRLDVRV